MSERGPKGDHGQHGDTGTRGVAGARGERGTHGDTGDPGERGAHGDTGQTGSRGRRGPSHWLAYVLMGVFVIIGFALFQGQVDKIDRLARENAKAGLALCALRGDLERRVESGRDFLAKHPDGAFGLSPQEIRTSIDNQQRTVVALEELNCPLPRK